MKKILLVSLAFIMSAGFTSLVKAQSKYVINFESDAVGKVYSNVAWYATDVTSTVAANATGSTAQGANLLHVTCTNYGAATVFDVTLPAGYTVADITGVSFDLYFNNAYAGDQNFYKGCNYFFKAPGSTLSPSGTTGSVTNIIVNDPLQTWLTKSFVPTITDAAVLALNQFTFALGFSGGDGDFYLDNITFLLPSKCTPPAPSNSVPGVIVTKPGDAWGGANIILGNSASVWPWSTAATDGAVAFTPVQGATYHMTLNITSTGASGYRVRWIKAAGYGAWTTADNNAVGSSATFSTTQVSTTLPALATGVANGETDIYKLDFTMDGSQPADGLVGSIGIFGYQGSSAYTINTIQITDDAGCILVNYDASATTGIKDVNADKSQAYGIAGGIVVNVAASENVAVYTVTGQLVDQAVVVNSKTFAAAKGLYIVKIGAKAVKVAVK